MREHRTRQHLRLGVTQGGVLAMTRYFHTLLSNGGFVICFWIVISALMATKPEVQVLLQCLRQTLIGPSDYEQCTMMTIYNDNDIQWQRCAMTTMDDLQGGTRYYGQCKMTTIDNVDGWRWWMVYKNKALTWGMRIHIDKNSKHLNWSE